MSAAHPFDTMYSWQYLTSVSRALDKVALINTFQR
jgi:hypothetical protein